MDAKTEERMSEMIETLGSKILVSIQGSTIENLKSTNQITNARLKWFQIIGIVTAAASFGAMFSIIVQQFLK